MSTKYVYTQGLQHVYGRPHIYNTSSELFLDYGFHNLHIQYIGLSIVEEVWESFFKTKYGIYLGLCVPHTCMTYHFYRACQ